MPSFMLNQLADLVGKIAAPDDLPTDEEAFAHETGRMICGEGDQRFYRPIIGKREA